VARCRTSRALSANRHTFSCYIERGLSIPACK
jgi:hypothetical protein